MLDLLRTQIALGSFVLTAVPTVLLLYYVLSLAVQFIVIGPVCVFATDGRATCVCLWVCYHDNSKLRASIITRLGF